MTDIKDLKPGTKISVPNNKWYKTHYNYGIIDSTGLRINWYGPSEHGWDNIRSIEYEKWDIEIISTLPEQPSNKILSSRINSIEIG